MIRDGRSSSEVVLIGIGSNLGDRQGTIESAVDRLSGLLEVEAVSALYESSPEGNPDQGDFLNAVLRGRSRLDPSALLDGLLAVERAFGRIREAKNGPRTLDLDLLFFGDRIVDRPGLTLPHPRWRTRAFVVVPLLEVAEDVRDPVSGRLLEELASPAEFSGVVRRHGELGAGPHAARSLGGKS